MASYSKSPIMTLAAGLAGGKDPHMLGRVPHKQLAYKVFHISDSILM